MGERADESYVSLQREVGEAIQGQRYRLALSLIDVLEARAVDDEQRRWLRDVRGSVEAALRLEDRR